VVTDRTSEVRMPWSLRVIFWLLAAMLLLMSSLAASASAAPTPAASPCQLRGDETTQGADLWAEVAAQVPTFAGLYVDEDTRTLYVLLTDGGQSLKRAVHALQTIVRSPDLCEFTPVPVHALYSYEQLKAWNDRMDPAPLPPGFVFSGIDEVHNRLVVGLEDPATQSPFVKAQLADLGIPLEAVRIVQSGPVVLGVAKQSLLPILVGSAIVGVVAIGGLAAFLARRKKRRFLHEGSTLPSSPMAKT
jgi:hypothetical protein